MTIGDLTIDRIKDHGARTYPEECCGFLVGSCDADGSVHVVDATPVDNVRGGLRERRYRISPEDFVLAERSAEKLGYGVVGFYHSHPDHRARPSTTDLAEATFPGYVYVIVSVVRGRPSDVTAWTLADDRTGFEEETLSLTPTEQETS